jgi:hypothetical protein
VGKVDAPQIYAVQFIDEWRGLPSPHSGEGDDVDIEIYTDANMGNDTSPPKTISRSSILMTSSDDYIHLWELKSEMEDEMKLESLMDIKFTHLEHGYGGIILTISTLFLFEKRYRKQQKPNMYYYYRLPPFIKV